MGLQVTLTRHGLARFAAAFLGVYGLFLAGIMILTHAALQNSFGISYLAPWSQLEIFELQDTVSRRPLWLRRRMRTYHPTDKNRLRKKGNHNHD
jgi:hypothetical protein